ncbi:AP2-like ethylene-responsive transcription factor PLT2 isoform X2 [Dioscorea cayenensis subsp. rotundata]|uniref:AP2-like ethylene-responsive transcription factor PLT2 isoform X2 n=1 Tax=Dioscorea cayennensis subsp. rotundata TaxID=55577 RepID=A0AB40B6P5_DIOCR|nr:AP2-like ethylene-responsive transcription factor PLT2 isoform X2 [Dioscorea cayenensis subsp. rotundata]
MDVMLIKSEISGNGKRLLGVAGGSSESGDQVVKCIKRRRREPALPPISVDHNHGGVLEQSPSSSTIKRSSRFRGVSRHRWTGRYEAHLWDKGSWNATQKKKGKQVYLGAYDEEESAARAYDLAALKYWGPTTFTNFPVPDYEKELEIMQSVTREEYLASLRRKSSGFSRGVSKYRGVARHHHNGRWEARIGRVFGNKYLYLGTYSTQEEAAHAYDIAAIEYRGINAVTNFDLSTYIRWLRPGGSSTTTPIMQTPQEQQQQHQNTTTTINGAPLRAMQTPSSAALFANTNNNNNESDHQLVLSPRNPFVAASTGSSSPLKQEIGTHYNQHLHNQFINGSSGSKSSPTALSLLLRSSVFRELVEKNSSVCSPNEEIIEGEEVKDDVQYNHGMICQGIAEHVNAYAGNGSAIELQDGAPFLWNGVMAMPSIQ